MKKRYWIPLLILAILIGVRIALPYWVTNYVNKTLGGMEGYTGSIQGVDLHIIQGAYAIDSLSIDKVEANNEVPFMTIEQIYFSLDWSALFRGAIVGDVLLVSPALNFVAPYQDDGEFGQEVDWPQMARDMMPIRINRFAIENGIFRYRDFSTSPEVDIPVTNLELEITNITNAKNTEQELPTHLELYATTIGDGYLGFVADLFLMKEIPDIDATLEIEQVYLPALNDFLEAYAAVDAESGEFNLYSEIVINNGIVEGYLRPLIVGLKIIDLKDPEGNVLEIAWEGIVGFLTEVFENQPEDQFATEIPLEGDLNNVETNVYTAIWNILQNAFVEAFSQSAGGQIEFGDH